MFDLSSILMKDIVRMQKYVDRTVERIRKELCVNLEYISIEYDPEIPTFMETQHGKIKISDNENASSDIIEYGILHEIEHRTVRSLNPNFNPSVTRKLLGYDADKCNSLKLYFDVYVKNFYESYVSVGMIEGSAEFFAIDVFSKICDVSVSCKFFMIVRATFHESFSLPLINEYALGYNFFHEMNNNSGLQNTMKYERPPVTAP